MQRFNACMHLFQEEGKVEDLDGGMEGRDRDLSWEGMAEVVARMEEGQATEKRSSEGEGGDGSVVAEPGTPLDRGPQGGAAMSLIQGMQGVEADNRVETWGPGTEAEAAVGQGMMSEDLEVEVGGDDTAVESGAEGSSCDWDFTVQIRNMHRQREREGWKGWREGEEERYRAQGHEGSLWSKEGLEWVKGDAAVWGRKQLAREERFCAQGYKGLPWQKEWMAWLETDIVAQETGATAAGEAAQPTGQGEGEGSDMEGTWPGEELKAKGRELELEGWRVWKAAVVTGERDWEGGT